MFKVNNYFDGNVTSVAFQGNGLPSTVGVMAPGEYTFDTSQHEVMTVVSGALTVQLPGNERWQEFQAGQSFEVGAKAEFNLKVHEETAYLCTYS